MVALRGIGLGRNFADYWEAGIELSAVPASGVVVRPHVSVLRQGEGDFRNPFPRLPATDHPFLFEGLVETRWRVGVGVSFFSPNGFNVSGSGALHALSNPNPLNRTLDVEFVGRLVVSYLIGTSLLLGD